MIAMLDTCHDPTKAQSEIGCPVEQLITPLTRRSNQNEKARFAIDNGAFAGFDARGFVSLLKREECRRGLCRFVAVPDVVGSAIRTLEVFEHWAPIMQEWPLALVAQDGQENLPIPWDRIAAIFIGGSTEWKMGPHAAACIKACKAIGKWCHVGRVNTPGRFEYFDALGADSIDGTGISQYSWMREAIYRNRIEPKLI